MSLICCTISLMRSPLKEHQSSLPGTRNEQAVDTRAEGFKRRCQVWEMPHKATAAAAPREGILHALPGDPSAPSEGGTYSSFRTDWMHLRW